MRGEHSCTTIETCSLWGSSPHARGTLDRLADLGHLAGIIPACAGNTAEANVPNGAEQDHPRMRGEHLNEVVDVCPVRGSSPHARGTLVNPELLLSDVGIIPACAGNTSTPSES